MSNDRIPAKPEPSTGLIGEGLKRRDFLLSGSSLVAASALSAVGLTSPAKAQQPATAPAAAGQRPNIVVIMGDDIGIWNIGAYHRGDDGRSDTKSRQDRRRRHAVHRLLRRSELHGGSRQLYHRRAADPHRHDHGWPGRRSHRLASGGRDHCHCAERYGLCHRPVRQEPPWRQE